MATVFQNDSGTWNYGTKVYGSLSEAQAAERADNQRMANMFHGNNSSSTGSLIGFVVKIGLFFVVCSFIATFWYVVLPIAVSILTLIIRSAIKKSHAKKTAINNEKIEEFFQAKDFNSIFPLLKENADKYKDGWSMYYLAMAYKNGEGTEPSEEKFMEYLKNGAKHDCSMAQYLYGSLLAMDDENASEEQKKRGFKYLKKSTFDYNSSDIQSYRYNLALAYYFGSGTKKNEAKARKILEGLANMGNTDAKEMLAKMN